jgi:ATP-dependent DNA helicase RecG
MIEDARKHKCPEPKFAVNGFFTANFWPNVEIARKITKQVSEQVDEQVTILKFCSTSKQKQEILAHLGLRSVYLNFKRHIQLLVKQELLEMTIPEKPQSSKQRYLITNLGRKILSPKGWG